MFNIGFSELVIIALIGIIFIGPEQLPVFARKLASLLNELKRAKDEIMKPVEDIKSEAQRAVNKMRAEAQKAQSKLDEDLRNKVTAILNKDKMIETKNGDSSDETHEIAATKVNHKNDKPD